jgi:hypothetical protein
MPARAPVRRFVITTGVALLAALPLALAAQQRADGRGAAQLARDVTAAEARGDTKFLASAWAPDYTEINQFGAVHTRAERLAAIRAKETVFQSIRVMENNVRAYGDTAVVALRLMVRGKLRGKPIDGEVRSLSIYVKRGSRWQAVATQYTRVQGR